MAGIRISNFKGMLPRRSQRLLPDNYAANALNTDFETGDLRGFHMLEEIEDFDPTDVKYAYRIPNNPDPIWLTLDTADADVVRSPITNDAYDRYYWTSDNDVPRYNTQTRIDNGDPAYRLGIPRPTTSPTLTPTGGTGPTVDRVYTYAFVSGFGEIGPAADPVTASGNDDGTWGLTNIETTVPDQAERNITHVNIYRTVTSAAGVATYFYVDQIAFGVNFYNDTKPTTEVSLNEQYDGFSDDGPPADLQGLLEMPGGFLVGFADDDLYFSQPFRPHAWPVEFILTMEYPIIGIAAYQNSVMVLTTSKPQAAIGSTPNGMTLVKEAGIEPCLSKRSVVTAPEGVYYASQNGLVLATPGRTQVQTKQIFTRDNWRGDYDPDDILAVRLGTKYLALRSDGTGFAIDIGEEGGAITDISELQAGLVNVLEDPWTGEVFYIANNVVYAWDSLTAPRIEFEWTSKKFQLPQPVNFGACMVYLTPIPGSPSADLANKARLEVYVGGSLVWTKDVGHREQHRLPSGFKHTEWQFKITSGAEVHSLAVAETGMELAKL